MNFSQNIDVFGPLLGKGPPPRPRGSILLRHQELIMGDAHHKERESCSHRKYHSSKRNLRDISSKT